MYDFNFPDMHNMSGGMKYDTYSPQQYVFNMLGEAISLEVKPTIKNIVPWNC